MKNINI